MRRMYMLGLLLIFIICFSGNLFAQVIVDIGTDTATNTNTGAPAPYGTWYRAFRQQFLVTADELNGLGAAAGYLNALAFNVASLDDCTPMTNYRIRIKDTDQAALNTTFEVGDYEEVFQAASFMPTDGWNLHAFQTPYFWDGVSNLIIDIVTDTFTGNYAHNALCYMTNTGFDSSLRFNSDSANGTTGTTGSISQNRSNMRFFMDIGEVGSLSGTVASGTTMISDVLVTIEDTPWSQFTAANGRYSFPAILIGDYQVTAHKMDYENVTLPVTISEGEASVLNFDLPASIDVDITGTVVGSDNPTVGLDNATILFSGPSNYEVVTNAQGQFSVTVLSGNTYDYTIMRDGYQATTGTINVGNMGYNMDTVIIEELTFLPGPVFAELNDTKTAIELTWGPPWDGNLSFDFEGDDGGWEPSSSIAGDGDWEYTDSYDVANFVATESEDNTVPPPTAYSGTGMWGTNMYENYSNSSSFSYLSKTFDFSSLSDATMRFMSWENVYGNWDYCQVSVNGTIVWGPSWDSAFPLWQERIIDLSVYDGMPEVTISFEFYATAVVAYGGWYIDDVEIGMASEFGPPTVNLPSIDLRFAGLSETEAANLVAGETIRSPHNEYNRRAGANSSPGAQRIPVGYKVWRLILGEEDQENLWTELTAASITNTVFTDHAWLTLPDATYKWAVKTVYTNNVLSEPRFSNTIRMKANDLSALEIYGNTSPSANSPISHTVVVKNTGNAAQDAGSYTVKIMQDTNELASGTGPALAVDEVVEIALSWIPIETGYTTIHGLVSLPGDSEPANDQTPPLEITVMDEGTFVVQLGDGTANNYMPVNTYYGYSYSQSLYKAYEIPGTHLEKISYHWNGVMAGTNNTQWTIYMGHTDKEAFVSNTDWVDFYELTEVYQGTVNIPAQEMWIDILLDTSFEYNGIDNLVIAVREAQPGHNSSACFFYNTPSTIGRSLRCHNDNIVPDPEYPPYGTLTAAYPNIRMNFSSVPLTPALSYSPENIDFDNVTYGVPVSSINITIMNKGGGFVDLAASNFEIRGANADMFHFDDDMFPVSLTFGENVSIPVYVTGTIEGPISASLVIIFAGEEYEIGLSANVLPRGIVEIGDGVNNNYMPVNPYYGYSYSQTLYTADEIVIQDLPIEKIAYHWNGVSAAPNTDTWEIYMGHTHKTAYSHTNDWISIDDLVPVYQGIVNVPAIEQWIEIELDIPFEYNGVDNLVIATRETKSGYDSSSCFFYNTASTPRRSIRCQSYSVIPNPASPPAGDLDDAYPNIRIMFDSPHELPTLRLHQYAIDFGELVYGRRSKSHLLRLSNAGEGTLTLNASDISLIGDEASMFEFDASIFPVYLEYNDWVELPVYLMGTTAGEVLANLVINYDGIDHVIPLRGDILPEGIFYVGDPYSDTYNSPYSYPTPYGNYVKKFREQYLVKKEEILESGNLAGHINSVAFNVHEVNLTYPMPNYCIRIKETQLENLGNFFEEGEYTLAYQSNSYFPTLGWNIHEFDEPFFWDGESNFLIEIEIDELDFNGYYNSTVHNTETDFISTVRSQIPHGSTSTYPAYVRTERPNMLIEVESEALGGLSGIVTEDGRTLPGVDISILGSDFVTTTNYAGYYIFPYAPAGTHVVQASKYGYDPEIQLVSIIQGQVAEYNFSMTGTPEFAIDTNSWDFGVVNVGESAVKTVSISNPAGGELVIQSINVEGSDAFSLANLAQLPITIYNEKSTSFDIMFSPNDSEVMEATVVITDNLNRSRRLGTSSSARHEVDFSPYEIILRGEGKYLADIGDQQLVSIQNSAPNPYSVDQNTFREQYLILAEELLGKGVFPGYVDDIGFNVAALNSVETLINHKISLKNTQQNSLSDMFEAGDYEEVYFAGEYTPTIGWNIHSLDTSFLWDGYSNILVDISSNYHSNANRSASVFYSETPFNSTIRRQTSIPRAKSEEPGVSHAARANMRLGMRSSHLMDMVALDLVGSAVHEIANESILTFRLRNISPQEVSNYNVLLLDDNENVLVNVVGTPIMPLQTIDMDIPWIPNQTGNASIFARIVMPEDENPDNDDSPMLDVIVFDEGLETVHIGDGTTENSQTGSPTPYATWRKTFREQYLFTMEDLYDMGAAPGEISAISFDAISVNQVVPMQNYRIRVKTTEQEDLSPIFETGEYIQVFQRDSFMPVEGMNLHIFDEPFMWNGWDNLIVDIVVDENTMTGRNAIVYNSETSYNSSAKYQSDSGSGLDGMYGSAINRRPNTILHIISEDLGSVAGVVTKDGIPLEGVEIKLEGTEWETITEADGYFRFHWVPVGNYTLSGFKYAHKEFNEHIYVGHKDKLIFDIDMPLLPKAFVSGRVLGSDKPDGLANVAIYLIGFENYELISDLDGYFNVEVFGENEYQLTISTDGYLAHQSIISVGVVDLDLGNIILNEIAYPASDLTAEINPRYDGIILDWSPPIPEADNPITRNTAGRRSPLELSSVNGTDSRAHIGYNLWRLISGDEDNFEQWSPITLNALSDIGFVDSDWLSLPDGDYVWALKAVYDAGISSSPIFSNELTKSNADGVLSGFILESGTQEPIANAAINIDGNFALESAADGSYSIEVGPGPHVVSVSQTYYYATDAEEFIILPTETTNLNITMQSLPKVEISGTILASDTSEGFEGVSLSFLGFMDYEIQTNENGAFAFDIYADKDYSYTISKQGYVDIRGNISVSDVDYDMGTITLYEIAYPPSNLSAEINNEYTAVELSWNAPDIRGFEGYQLWRLSAGEEDNKSAWISLSENTVAGTSITDESWAVLDDGDYLWAVSSVYSAGVLSEPVFSQTLTKSNTHGLLVGIILDQDDDSPIMGASITLNGEIVANTDAEGKFTIELSPGPHSYIVSHTYYYDAPEVQFVMLPAEELEHEIQLLSLPRVTLLGNIIANDTDEALAGVEISLTGFMDYQGISDENGEFSFYLYAEKSYEYSFTKPAYAPLVGEIEIGTSDLDMGELVLEEVIYQPSALIAEINDDYTAVSLSWNAPDIRVLSGYDIWRLSAGDEDDQAAWTLLNDELIIDLEYIDNAWFSLADGDYLWALKAYYSSDAYSEPIFSNTLPKYSDGGTLAGFITDLEDETPVVGAIITVDDEITAITDAAGAYSVILPPGPHTMKVAHTYYEDSDEQVFAIIPFETTTINLALQSLPKILLSGSVSGTDTVGGLAGASVNITGFADYELETDASGEFATLVYAEHQYEYTISKDGYEPASGTFQAENVDFDLGHFVLTEIAYMPSDLVAAINDTYTAVELSWNAPQVRGLEGYQIWRMELQVPTQRNEYGDWVAYVGQDQTSYTDESWQDLADGDYIWIVQAQYTADVISDPIYSNILYKSNADGLLTGFILDSADESPILDATITVDGELTAISSDTGAYSFILAPGPHSLIVSHTFYEDSDEINFVILPDEITNLNIELESLPRVMVSGTVLASDTGEGLAGVDITVTGFMDYSLETVTDGSFSVLAYAGYTYDFELSKDGYESFSGELEVGYTDLNLGDITLNETAYMPSDLVAVISDDYTAINLSWNAPQTRGLEGYQVWRMKDGDQASENQWSLLTATPINATTFEDTNWLTLSNDDYLWAVKAIYTAEVVSEPIFSNMLTKLSYSGTLAGIILDEADNSPIAGAVITVDGEHTAVSGDTGAYTLSLLPGPHTVIVSHTYFEDSDEIDFVILPDETTNLNIELESLPKVLVSGTVLASDTGEGLAGVDISVTGFMDYNLETDADGSFSGLAYAGHTYDFELSKAGYESFSGELEVGYTALNLGEITLYEIAYMPSDLTASINDTYTAVELSWNAPDPENNLGYQVWRLSDTDQDDETLWSLITPETISTTSFTDNGWTGLADGDYLWASKAIYAAGVISEPIFSDALTKSNTDGILAGFILDEADESPIAGALITVDDEYTTQSDDTGAYTMNLAPGPHTVIVSHTYFEDSDELSFVILPDETTNLNIELESLPQVMVSGRIIGSDTGAGLEGVDIAVTGFMDYNFQTDASGHYSVLAYANHSYEVSVSKAGYESLYGEVDLGNESLDLGDFMLMEIAYMPTNAVAEINPIHTAVTINWNAPVPDHAEILSLSEIIHGKAQDSHYTQNTRAAIGYSVWRLNEGQEDDESTWNLLTDEPIVSTQFLDEDWLDLDDGSYLWAIKAVYNAGIISDALFSNELEKEEMYGTLFGYVKNTQDDTPISGVLVSIDAEINTLTDESGYYSFSLLAGEYTITASHDEYTTVTIEDIIIIGGESFELDIDMEPTSNSDLVEIAQTKLIANYPNPFNPETTIAFYLKDAGRVSINIYNMRGQLIRKLVDSDMLTGDHSVIWDGRDNTGRSVSSGTYLYRMQAGKYSSTKKMIMMK